MRFTLLNWDCRISFNARWPLTHFKIHRYECTWHLVWGKLSIAIDNWALEIHPLCAECGSADVAERGAGDEYLTVCGSCRSVEQGYRYVNLREYERAS